MVAIKLNTRLFIQHEGEFLIEVAISLFRMGQGESCNNSEILKLNNLLNDEKYIYTSIPNLCLCSK
jgi:hypothetical protein